MTAQCVVARQREQSGVLQQLQENIEGGETPWLNLYEIPLSSSLNADRVEKCRKRCTYHCLRQFVVAYEEQGQIVHIDNELRQMH